jgi:YidC/Oxa1 family membrane protein insertase
LPHIPLFEPFAAGLAAIYGVVGSYGVAIILLTIVVRAILLPLSIKQTKSMREMQRIQPEVKKLQAKYKGDRQKVNEAMMALYKEHGVNPFGGCLPLLMQFPVLIALYRVIRAPLAYLGYTNLSKVVTSTHWVINHSAHGIFSVAQNSALAKGLQQVPIEVNRFLGLRLDCGAVYALRGERSPTLPDSTYPVCGHGVVSALPYLVLVLLMGVTTWYQQKQMQGTKGAATDPQQQQMQMFTKFMPVMLMFFAFSFPIGVVFYWLTTNVLTILQQQFILGKVTVGAAPAGAASSALADGSSKGPAKLAKKPPPKTTPGKTISGKAVPPPKTTPGKTISGKAVPPGKAVPGNGAPPGGARSQASKNKKKKK